MKAQRIIDHLNQQGSWVNFDKTRDIVLFGDPNQEVTRIGVCWIVTLPAIHQAVESGINFIVTHENCFYEESTSPHQKLVKARQVKRELLAQHGICIVRCHDVWDRMPDYGIPDSWAATMGFDFESRPVTSFYKYARFSSRSVKEVATQIAHGIRPYGQDRVSVLGDPNQLIGSIAVGTGAITDVFNMLKEPVDCLVVTDDGITNWIGGQYAVDYAIPLIITHHPVAEIPGMHRMVEYLRLHFPELDSQYLDEGYRYHTFG